jgi:glutamate dehydrogenase (NAD(P)+)
LHDAECRIVAISDLSGGYYRKDGIDVPSALHYANQNNRSLAGYTEAEMIANEALLELGVDVLIPAALGGVITAENAPRIAAPIIVEGANAPVRPEADQILFDRGTTVLPDILANAGGVTVSYFEWVQNRQFYHWGLNRVRQELDHVLSEAFQQVWETAADRKVSLRTAAFILAINRVGRATALGGI